MNRFAELLDRLAYEPGRNNKLRLMTEYFRSTPDPERGWALAALTGSLSFQHAKPNVIRALIAERTDPVLFELSWDYVGDLSETVALMWPAPDRANAARIARRAVAVQVVETLATLGKAQLPAQLARWLDALDETGRWALLKLVTAALRVGVSARLAKTAVAALGDKDPHEVELIWPGLQPPYVELFAWLEGRADKPATRDPAPFRPAMLAHALEDGDLAALDPGDFMAEWKWDGIRVQAVCRHARRRDAGAPALFAHRRGHVGELSRPGRGAAARRRHRRRASGGARGPRAVVQRAAAAAQPQDRHAEAAGRVSRASARLRSAGRRRGGSARACRSPSGARGSSSSSRALDDPRVDLSPLVPFATWEELAAARADPAAGAAPTPKRSKASCSSGAMRPTCPAAPRANGGSGSATPCIVDAVLMYAQRGSGKRSSYYSDYTFGVWTKGEDGDVLVPVGKAYFGFTDEELIQIDRFVRRNTADRFGPVREVVHEADQGLVLEVAFEGLQRSTRHKSGLAMRFPRISRLRWDKPPREADRLDTLEQMLEKIETRTCCRNRGESRNVIG